jgi:hypothetical protein
MIAFPPKAAQGPDLLRHRDLWTVKALANRKDVAFGVHKGRTTEESRCHFYLGRGYARPRDPRQIPVKIREQNRHQRLSGPRGVANDVDPGRLGDAPQRIRVLSDERVGRAAEEARIPGDRARIIGNHYPRKSVLDLRFRRFALMKREAVALGILGKAHRARRKLVDGADVDARSTRR